MDKRFSEIDEALAVNDLKRAEVAIARLLRGKNTSQERADLLFRRAKARLQAARPDDALEDLQTATALHQGYEDSPESKMLRGDIYFARYELAPVGFADRTDADTALTCYEEMIIQQPHHPDIAWVHYQVGRVRLSQNDIPAAVRHFQQVLQAPCNPPTIYALSHERLGFIALYEQRQPDVALTHFQKAVAQYPHKDVTGWLAQLHLRISRAHLELGQHQAALDSARKALREIQDAATSSQRLMLPEAHMAIGDILATMPNGEAEAIEHYLRFLQSSKRPPGIDVTWSKIHETLGQLYFRQEDYQKAIDAYEGALAFNPYHPWEVNLRYQMARCYYRLRAYERAVDAIKKLQHSAAHEQVEVTDWRVFNLLGNAHFALEQYEQAAAAYRRAIELAPPGATGLDKAQIYLRFSEELMGSDLR